MAVAPDGTLWIATDDREENEAIFSVPRSGAARHYAPGKREWPITSLAPAVDGALWVADNTRTISRFLNGRLATAFGDIDGPSVDSPDGQRLTRLAGAVDQVAVDTLGRLVFNESLGVCSEVRRIDTRAVLSTLAGRNCGNDPPQPPAYAKSAGYYPAPKTPARQLYLSTSTSFALVGDDLLDIATPYSAIQVDLVGKTGSLISSPNPSRPSSPPVTGRPMTSHAPLASLHTGAIYSAGICAVSASTVILITTPPNPDSGSETTSRYPKTYSWRAPGATVNAGTDPDAGFVLTITRGTARILSGVGQVLACGSGASTSLPSRRTASP